MTYPASAGAPNLPPRPRVVHSSRVALHCALIIDCAAPDAPSIRDHHQRRPCLNPLLVNAPHRLRSGRSESSAQHRAPQGTGTTYHVLVVVSAGRRQLRRLWPALRPAVDAVRRRRRYQRRASAAAGFKGAQLHATYQPLIVVAHSPGKHRRREMWSDMDGAPRVRMTYLFSLGVTAVGRRAVVGVRMYSRGGGGVDGAPDFRGAQLLAMCRTLIVVAYSAGKHRRRRRCGQMWTARRSWG